MTRRAIDLQSEIVSVMKVTSNEILYHRFTVKQNCRLQTLVIPDLQHTRTIISFILNTSLNTNSKLGFIKFVLKPVPAFDITVKRSGTASLPSQEL